VLRGDPTIVDRLKRAVGAYQLRTGKEKAWKELAAETGLTASQMTEIVGCTRRVQIADAAAFGRVLGVRPAWIAFGEEPMEPARPIVTGLPKEPERAVDDRTEKPQRQPRVVGEVRSDPASRPRNRPSKGDTPRGRS
jgi:hypothetical protein